MATTTTTTTATSSYFPARQRSSGSGGNDRVRSAAEGASCLSSCLRLVTIALAAPPPLPVVDR